MALQFLPQMLRRFLSREVQLTRGVTTIFDTTPTWTTKDIAVRPVSDVDAATPNTSVVLAVIASNTALAGGICALGIVAACITLAVVAVLTNFYLIYATIGTSDSPVRRDVSEITAQVHEFWKPTESISTLAKLKANTNEGVWVSIGNTTINGTFHDVHFQQLGSMLGVKAIQSTTGMKERRDDADDEGGFVAAYFWEDNNQQA